MSDPVDETSDRSELISLLALERAKYHGLADILPQQVWTTTPQGEVDFFNSALAGYFSQPAERFMGLDWVAVIHPDDLAQSMGIFGHALQVGEPFQLECRILRHDGQYRWHLSRGLPLHDAEGNVVKWLGMVSDLTDSREAEHLAAIVANTDDAIISMTPDAIIETWNPGATRIFGVTAANAIDREFTATLNLEAEVDIGSVVTRVMNTRVARALDARTTTADGVALDLVLTISPIVGVNNEVTGASAIGRDVTERRRMERALEHQALHDALTGLPNRSLFMDRLRNALARSGRDRERNQFVAVMFIDLDNFKIINDSLGHGPGDDLLTAVAPRLTSLLRDGDTVARFGGDEFVVLCDGVESEKAIERIAGRIVEAMNQPFEVGGVRRTISASVGVAVATPGATAEDLISAADTAMYRAKDAGRARHVIFDESLRDRVRTRLDLEHDMRQALKHGGFYLAYQPILGIAGESLGLEALLRWDRPGHRPVSPADVIVEAERNGLIVPLGNWVLHEACRQAAKWSQQVRPVRVSVNLSPRQLDDPSFIDGVAKVLDQTGLNPAYLQLEITESILLHGASAQILRDLRALGVGTVLDDFGTGYSSLSYLKMFDLDSVKIDKTFVDGVGVSQTDTAIVQAVVLIARALGIQVIAEGVEEPDQLRLLRELGCDAVQGYVASRPLPDSSVGHLLRRWQPGADLIGIERLAHPDGSRGAFLES